MTFLGSFLVNLYSEELTRIFHITRLMPLHFLGHLQFQLQKFDCIIIGHAELAPRGGRTNPMAGQVRPS